MLRLASNQRSFCQKAGKPFESLPRPKIYPFVGSILGTTKKFAQMHVIAKGKVDTLGKIFYDKIFNFKSVFIADPKTTAALFRNEGKYPTRIQIPVFQYPRLKRGIPLTVLLSDGEDWYRMRRAIDKQLLTLSNIYKYIEPMNGTAEDFIKLLNNSHENHLSLREIAFRWSTESVCLFLYDMRLGCLSENPPPDTIAFYNAVETVFKLSNKLFALPPKFAKIISPFAFRKHTQAWYTIFDIGKVYFNKKLDLIDQKLKANEEVDGFLVSLQNNPTITKDEVFSLTVELMAAGVDTTGTTLLWFLHLMATNPDKQSVLHKELRTSGLNADSKITEIYIKNAPYLKACLKEAMRLRPIIMGTSRYLPQDTLLDGYCMSKSVPIINMDIVMANSEENYPNPTSFLPERWLEKSTVEDKANTKRFTSLPFGHGPRGCVGRRLAELEIYVLMAKLVNQYKIVSLNEGPVGQHCQMIIVPSVPIKIKLVKRTD